MPSRVDAAEMDAPDVLAIHDLLPRYGHVVIERRTVVARKAQAGRA